MILFGSLLFGLRRCSNFLIRKAVNKPSNIGQCDDRQSVKMRTHLDTFQHASCSVMQLPCTPRPSKSVMSVIHRKTEEKKYDNSPGIEPNPRAAQTALPTAPLRLHFQNVICSLRKNCPNRSATLSWHFLLFYEPCTPSTRGGNLRA